MARLPKPAEGSWTEHYPELGTADVSFETSIDPAYYDLERKAIFERAWLNVGRVEQLPRNGSYFTRELDALKTSLIICRDMDGQVRAYHNICRHRGNKLVWQDFPREEVSGSCRNFTCKYHAWQYGLDGKLEFVQQEDEFFDLDKAEYPLVEVHCDVWNGFIFVNAAEKPEWGLRDYLGPMITAMDDFPFEKFTERYMFRAKVNSNWKLYMDAFQEFYHAVVLHRRQQPAAMSDRSFELGFEAPYYAIDGPHRLVSTSGVWPWNLPETMVKPMDRATRSGLFGPWDNPDVGFTFPDQSKGLNPGGADPWGLDSYQVWPNFVILVWERGWYLTYHYWPTSIKTHDFDGNLYFVPPKDARERVAQEMAAVAFKEYAMQDANTLEATQMMTETGIVEKFPLGDQEVLCRHLHLVIKEWMADYQRQQKG